MDAMIDFETLDVTPSSVAVSVGICAFNKNGIKDRFYRVFEMRTQIKHGRTFSPDTLEWWMKPSMANARKVFFEPKKDTKFILEQIQSFLLSNNVQLFWAHGASFDFPILDSLFKQYEVNNPVGFWNYRCTREIFDNNPVPFRVGTHHNALDDAVYQAESLIQIWSK